MAINRQSLNGPWNDNGKDISFSVDTTPSFINIPGRQSPNGPSRGGNSSSGSSTTRRVINNGESPDGSSPNRVGGSTWLDQLPAEYQNRLHLNPYASTEPTQGVFEPWSKFQARWNAWKQNYDQYVAKIYDEYLNSLKSSASYQVNSQIAAGVRQDNISIDSSLASSAINPQDVSTNPEQFNYDMDSVFGAMETAVGIFAGLFSTGITGAMSVASLRLAQSQLTGVEYDNSIKALNAFSKASEVIGTDVVEVLQQYLDGSLDLDTGDERANKLLKSAFTRKKDSIPTATAQIKAENDLTAEQTRTMAEEEKNVEQEARMLPNYTIRDSNGNIVTEDASLPEYYAYVNRLRTDSYAIQNLMDIRQGLLDGIQIDNTIDYYNRYRKLSGQSYGSFQAATDYNIQKVEQDLNEAINNMRKSVYDAFDWLYQKAETGNGFAMAACATLGAASFSLPRAIVSDFIGTMNSNRQARLDRQTRSKK